MFHDNNYVCIVILLKAAQNSNFTENLCCRQQIYKHNLTWHLSRRRCR